MLSRFKKKQRTTLEASEHLQLPNVEARSAQMLREARSRGLPDQPEANPVEQDLRHRLLRAIESCAKGFCRQVQSALAVIRTAKVDTTWVETHVECWLTTIAVIEARVARRLGRVRKDFEDMDVARQITEFSEEILVPATAVMKRVKQRANIALYAMVGGDGVINGIVLRGVGVDGGLLTTWGIAFLMAGIIVGLGKALGGLLLPKLRRRDLPTAALSLIVVAAGLLVLLALYIAVALGIARASGSFDVFAMIKILRAPTEHIGALGLTIASGFFFIISTRLSYRFKRDVNERYECIVDMLMTLEQHQEDDLAQAQESLIGIPNVAAVSFMHLRQERHMELVQAEQCVAFVDRMSAELEAAVEGDVARVEDAIRNHRHLVAGIWRGVLPAYFKQEPDLRSEVSAALAVAKSKVASVHDRLGQIEAADGKLDAAIDIGLAKIQYAVRQAIESLGHAAYGPEGVPTSVSPARAPLKLVHPDPIGGDHAPHPAE